MRRYPKASTRNWLEPPNRWRTIDPHRTYSPGSVFIEFYVELEALFGGNLDTILLKQDYWLSIQFVRGDSQFQLSPHRILELIL